jgi:hypothetical protein
MDPFADPNAGYVLDDDSEIEFDESEGEDGGELELKRFLDVLTLVTQGRKKIAKQRQMLKLSSKENWTESLKPDLPRPEI